jgi:exopolysaccharide production protein ExoQ
MREAAVRQRENIPVVRWVQACVESQVLMSFLLTTLLLSVLKTATLGVAAFSLLVCFYAFVERKVLAKNTHVRLLAIFIGFGLLSAFWSLYPRQTLYYGLQIVLTMVGGMLIASSRRPFDSLIGAAFAFILHTLASHLFGKYVPWENGQVVFIGIDSAKNYYGGISGLTVLISMGMGFSAADRGRRLLAGFACVGVCLGAFGLLRSLAMGFTLSTLACASVMIYLSIYRILSNRLRFGVMLYVIYALVCSAFVIFLVRDSLLTMILTLTHKDMTLTGRTEIWEVANSAIKHYYWLGMGQNAFWVDGNPYAEKIWTANHIVTRKGFSLHNTFLDLWATLGLVGLSLYIFIAVSLIIIQFRRLLMEPSTTQITWFCVLLFFVLLSAVENFAPIAMNAYTFALAISQTYYFNPPVANTARVGSVLEVPKPGRIRDFRAQS